MLLSRFRYAFAFRHFSIFSMAYATPLMLIADYAIFGYADAAGHTLSSLALPLITPSSFLRRHCIAAISLSRAAAVDILLRYATPCFDSMLMLLEMLSAGQMLMLP